MWWVFQRIVEQVASFFDWQFNWGCIFLDAAEQTTIPPQPKFDSPIPTLAKPSCARPLLTCPWTSIHVCISLNQFCNGLKDCPGGFDEENCEQRCQSKSKLWRFNAPQPFLPKTFSYILCCPPQLTLHVKIVAAVFPGVWCVTAAPTAPMAQTRCSVPP